VPLQRASAILASMAVTNKTHTHLQLVHEPGEWTVTLRGGDVLCVRAHAYGEVDGSYQFVMLMEGDPPFESEVLRVPRDAVTAIRGG
jgi:hypothetical protein